ncbi:hypothetical protein SAMN02800692_1259 [Luteibacter sp. UNC138MFCol5.1]|nr:hypothetical protein [Luteibacter sp. UNC138MFCol5.1]SEO58430.1 hypothetical protein SAMN02800692_1259 [Luteibacter sp. UNC138MFCol5.1]SEV87202.1 hypothetical protein SAMN04515660_0497 [Luteibacter sp. 329MFSha]
MSTEPFVIDALRAISHDTIALVRLFEAGNYEDAAHCARRIVTLAHDARLMRVWSAAIVVQTTLARDDRAMPHPVDAGVVGLVEEVERASAALDSDSPGDDGPSPLHRESDLHITSF